MGTGIHYKVSAATHSCISPLKGSRATLQPRLLDANRAGVSSHSASRLRGSLFRQFRFPKLLARCSGERSVNAASASLNPVPALLGVFDAGNVPRVSRLANSNEESRPFCKVFPTEYTNRALPRTRHVSQPRKSTARSCAHLVQQQDLTDSEVQSVMSRLNDRIPAYCRAGTLAASKTKLKRAHV